MNKDDIHERQERALKAAQPFDHQKSASAALREAANRSAGISKQTLAASVKAMDRPNPLFHRFDPNKDKP